MASNSRSHSKGAATAPKHHNRVEQYLSDTDTQEELRREMDAAADELDLTEGELQSRMEGYVRNKKRTRRIDTDEETEKGHDINEAVVKTINGLPDMRYAENRNMYLKDTKAKANGKPDRRLIENRPQILQIHVRRGEDRPNLTFANDGEITE